MAEPEPATCNLPHYDWPETLCTEPAGHDGCHAAVLRINGEDAGGVAWGPDGGQR